MRKIFLLLLFFASFASAGFYFDFTLSPVIRHLDAIHTTSQSQYPNYNDEYLGYNGIGGLVSTRFGGLIKGVVAIYGNIELEITKGDVNGWNKKERSLSVSGKRPGSAFFGMGPGVTVYPFFKSTESIQNFYISTSMNIEIGSGGDIGLLGGNYRFETGYLWQSSERFYSGIAIGADILTTTDLDTHIKDEKGYSIWIGFKFIRK
ncbi:hypothetical protein [Fibrobacter sp. UWB12]|uniref:hypothetical protein n=1 Tax=Fibrobacter sp. UWB12 TaxID=1896203 RepID=UPI0009177F2D|nr:hypothetical protein [Fibrobacter sp. UWB12]SHK95454.1 hypothetical protein SAMN05720759_11040 [Fibrobacter sp. UWB12]